jgi:hypothetical protein
MAQPRLFQRVPMQLVHNVTTFPATEFLPPRKLAYIIVEA